MTLIIDGYNLLNVAGIFAPGAGPNTLERSRRALLDFLANSIAESEATRTTIVFDAKHAPPGLQRKAEYRGLTVQFAPKHQEADDLIEELIQADSAPRQLTVVSSDHRIQRAARRRKAVAIDSDVWCKQVVAAARKQENDHLDGLDAKTHERPSEDEVNAWLQRFGDVDVDSLERTDAAEREAEESLGVNLKDTDDISELDDLADPFPPGYGEDLLNEEH